MLKKITTLTILTILIFLFYFIGDIVNYQVNLPENKEKIESKIFQSTGFNSKIKNITISIDTIKISELTLEKEDNHIRTENIELSLNITELFSLNYNSLIKNISVDYINILRDDKTDKKGFSFNFDVKPLESYLKGINSIKIKHLSDIKFNMKNISLIQKNNILLGKSEISIFNETIQAETEINTTKLYNNEFELLLKLQSKFQLNTLNHFINNKNIKINKGTALANIKFNLKDKQLTSNGSINFFTPEVEFLQKTIHTNNFNSNFEFKNNLLNINLLNKLTINNNDIDISRIQVVPQNDFENIKKIIIKGKTLNIEGNFSQFFKKNIKKKTIEINFNQFPLTYLNKFNLTKLKYPLDNIMLHNGNINLNFEREKNDEFHLEYQIFSKALLKHKGIDFFADVSLKNNQITINNIFFDKIKQDGEIKYDISNELLNVELKTKINQEIFLYVKDNFKIPFDLTLDNNAILMDFSFSKTPKDSNYFGKIEFKQNNIALKYQDKPFNFENLNGIIQFKNHNIESINITADSLHQEHYKFKNIKALITNDSHNIKGDIFSDFVNLNLIYQKRFDSLKIKTSDINYLSENNSKVKKTIEENQKDLEELRKIKIPKKSEIFINNLKIDSFDLGNVAFEINKNDDNELKSTLNIKNNIQEAKLESQLNLNDLNLKNKLSLNIYNIGEFINNNFQEQIIKNGTLVLNGNFDTTISSFDLLDILKETKGKVNIQSSNGEILNINTGPTFLLNIFNIQTLPKLILLDFKSIFDDRFIYDSVKLHGELNNYIFTINDFQLNSNITKIFSSGSIDLKNKETKLQLVLQPKITRNILLATIGATSGFNPLVLLGTSMLEKIIPLPDILEYKYSIHGKINKLIIEKNK